MQYRYYVVVTDPADKPSIHQDLTASWGADCIPNRPIVCDRPLQHSLHNGIYYLYPEEAELLKNDPRVWDVHRDPVEIGIVPKPSTLTTGTFAKYGYANTNTDVNWGLLRSISKTEPFQGATATNAAFTFNLDGNGVDVVFMDSGIIKYHPEFAVNPDGTGGTRVVETNWSIYGVIPGNGITSWVGDNDGHGSNVASIACGNTQGWARRASIYSFNIIDPTLPTYTDPISALQTIRLWHNAKPTTSTGYKRPTVCSNSWGYDIQYANMTGTFWQGTLYPETGPKAIYGQISSDGSLPAANTSTTVFGTRITAIEAEILACQNAGIIFTGAAGNQAMKCDIPGGTDYNNYWIDNTNAKYYYHRGTTPSAATGVICVGAISYVLPEHKISFSNTGPRIDIFAPGSAIMGAYLNKVYADPAVVDKRSGNISTSTTATFYLNKVDGTSQSCPQVTGVVACLLESRPWYQSWQVLQWIKDNALVNTLSETYYGGAGYVQFAGLQGAANKQLYQPFNNPYPWSITSGF
jgi:hypothetical protein